MPSPAARASSRGVFAAGVLNAVAFGLTKPQHRRATRGLATKIRAGYKAAASEASWGACDIAASALYRAEFHAGQLAYHAGAGRRDTPWDDPVQFKTTRQQRAKATARVMACYPDPLRRVPFYDRPDWPEAVPRDETPLVPPAGLGFEAATHALIAGEAHEKVSNAVANARRALERTHCAIADDKFHDAFRPLGVLHAAATSAVADRRAGAEVRQIDPGRLLMTSVSELEELDAEIRRCYRSTGADGQRAGNRQGSRLGWLAVLVEGIAARREPRQRRGRLLEL